MLGTWITDSWLNVTGKDATEAFEDVGHSDEAREVLNGLYVGDYDGAVVSYLHLFGTVLIVVFNSVQTSY